MVQNKIEQEADKFISDIKAATNRSEEDIRETIVDIMNEGYENE